ncbi:MAG: murein hydrolase activator EnvC family protein [Coriobacteriia bacterium]
MKRSRAYRVLSLCLLLILVCAAPAVAATQSELSASRQRAADARAAAAEAQSKADALRKEVEVMDKKIAALESDVGKLVPQIEKATARTNKLKAEVASLRGSITTKEAEIKAVQADLIVQQELLDKRMASSYKQGDMFYLDLLLDSRDFNDLIARTTLVQRIISSDQDIAKRLTLTRNDFQTRKIELERVLQDVQTKRAEAEMVESNLRGLRAKRQSALDAQEDVQGQKADLMVENQANAKRLRAIAEEEEAESARIEVELRGKSSGSGQYNGVMAWPVPGFYRVSSPYGYRIHPIFGTRKLHTGIDIARTLDPPQSIDGAPIVASGSGEVVFAGYRGGYGNTVMIDHGDGVVTLYAHQQSGGIKVSNGDSVTKGERIGTVGSTGYSTGAHLHFEVRVNGAPVNPMGYLR